MASRVAGDAAELKLCLVGRDRSRLSGVVGLESQVEQSTGSEASGWLMSPGIGSNIICAASLSQLLDEQAGREFEDPRSFLYTNRAVLTR